VREFRTDCSLCNYHLAGGDSDVGRCVGAARRRSIYRCRDRRMLIGAISSHANLDLLAASSLCVAQQAEHSVKRFISILRDFGRGFVLAAMLSFICILFQRVFKRHHSSGQHRPTSSRFLCCVPFKS